MKGERHGTKIDFLGGKVLGDCHTSLNFIWKLNADSLGKGSDSEGREDKLRTLSYS